MGGATFSCDNLVALVDCNGIQADGPVTVAIEPVADKFDRLRLRHLRDQRQRHGRPRRCAGKLPREQNGKPKAIVLRTTPGFGVPTIWHRPRAHFVRVGDDEWVDSWRSWRPDRG